MRSTPPRPALQAINIGQTAFSYAVRRASSRGVEPTWSRTSNGPPPPPGVHPHPGHDVHHQVTHQVVYQTAPPPPPGFVAPAAFVVNPRHYDIQPRKKLLASGLFNHFRFISIASGPLCRAGDDPRVI